MRSIGSLFAIYGVCFGQSPPITVPSVPAVTLAAIPEVPALTLPALPAIPAIPTRPAAPIGQLYGAFGQLCGVPLKDTKCQNVGVAAIAQYPAFMKCERNFDCCLCGEVNCGNSWAGCNTFSAGDSGVYGVENINIIGRSSQLGGAAINCIGIESCAHSVINGENIKSIDAAGALSLRNAQVSIINPTADFSLDCIGLGACENLMLDIFIAGPPPGYQCNPEIQIETIEFAALQCSGQNSCKNMQLTIRNEGCHPIEIQQIECLQPNSCQGAQFTFFGDIEVNNCDLIGGGQIAAGLAQVCGYSHAQGGGQGGNSQFVPIGGV
jgi:hypothetical protein